MSDDDPSRLPVAQLGQYAREGELTDVQQEICRRVMEGESVRAICRDEQMPCRSTVLNWLASDPTFRTAYAMAKQLLAETLAEEIIEIADDASQDWKEGEDGRVFDHEHVQRAKLRVDSRKWLAGKLAPKRYGDSSMLRVGGMDAERSAMSQEEIAVRLAAIFESALKRKGN